MADRLQEIQARCEAATRGPWTYRSLPHDDWGTIRAADGLPVANTAMAVRNDDDPAPWDSEKGEFPESPTVTANGLFVTHCRSDVPFLLARIEALETALRFYADDAAYSQWQYVDGECVTVVIADRGARARAALEGSER